MVQILINVPKPRCHFLDHFGFGTLHFFVHEFKVVGNYGQYTWHISFVRAPNMHANLVNGGDPQARTTSLGIMLEMTLTAQAIL